MDARRNDVQVFLFLSGKRTENTRIQDAGGSIAAYAVGQKKHTFREVFICLKPDRYHRLFPGIFKRQLIQRTSVHPPQFRQRPYYQHGGIKFPLFKNSHIEHHSQIQKTLMHQVLQALPVRFVMHQPQADIFPDLFKGADAPEQIGFRMLRIRQFFLYLDHYFVQISVVFQKILIIFPDIQDRHHVSL